MLSPHEFLYSIPTIVIAIILLGLMLVAIHFGLRVGSRRRDSTDDETRKQASAVQASLLGLLALLLGFTFSLSLGRFEQRSVELVSEANAIGTAWLRTDLLGEERRMEARELLKSYATLRVQAAAMSGPAMGREALVHDASGVFTRLWTLAAEEAREKSTPEAMAFVASLNDMIDALGRRDAAINRHVPQLVLNLLLVTFILLGGVVGYASGISGVRPGVPVHALMLLIVVLVFLIFDLDRPRRGLVEVNQEPLISTVEGMVP